MLSRSTSTLLVGLLLVSANLANAQKITQAQRNDFVSDASFVIGTYRPATIDHAPEAIARSARKFIESLDVKQVDRVSLELTDPERREWTNLPARPNAGGVRLGEMTVDDIKRLCDLMANLFSEQGYKKMCDIMLADDQLLTDGRPRPGFGTENFSIVVFGNPESGDASSWAFQIDGHHVGVNVSVNNDQMTMAPSFIGTQPEAFTIAGTKYQPFAGETGDAYELVSTLSDEQIKQAVLQLQRGRIVTGPGNDGKVPVAKGVSCSTFNDGQKKLLVKLIANWVNDLPSMHAEKRIKQIENEIDQMKFSWNGNKQPGSDISYTIQGPSLIIEYACQDLGGNPLAHLHSMYRNPTNDYAKQLD